MMTCKEFEQHVNDFVDGFLDEETTQKVEAHIASCAVCHAQAASLRALLEEVHRMPQRIEPSRDLWAGILDRIEEAPPENVVRFETFRKKVLPRTLVAVAAVGIVFIGLVFSQVAQNQMNPVDSIPPVVAEADAKRFENEYLQARDELRGALEEKKAALSPEMLAVIEENLAIIENAVVDINRAIANNPNNHGLERKLHAAYTSEVTLLRHAVLIDDDI